MHAVFLPEPPWVMKYLLVPNLECSTVRINCKTDSDSPFWSINLSNDSINAVIQFHFRAKQLNDHGVYELPPIKTPDAMAPILRLLINDTQRNNLTEIKCIGEKELYSLTLLTFRKKR